jgi:hypothetical protein
MAVEKYVTCFSGYLGKQIKEGHVAANFPAQKPSSFTENSQVYDEHGLVGGRHLALVPAAVSQLGLLDPGVDLMKPFRPKFTDKTKLGQLQARNYDFVWL